MTGGEAEWYFEPAPGTVVVAAEPPISSGAHAPRMLALVPRRTGTL